LGILQDLEKFKLIGSNVEDEKIPDSELFKDLDIPRTNIRTVDDNPYWEVLYPVRSKSGKNIVAYIYAEVSMKVVSRVTGIFFKITVIGALVAILLLIWSLSFYLKRLIENEKLLRIAEVEKVELTEQLQLTQQQLFLNEKLAIMGQLTASFAHEIGTPLHSLLGHLQLLSGELKNKKDLDRIEIINSQVSRIEGIVKNFLASTHSPTQKKEMVDVHLMLEKIINLVSPRLQNQKIEVQFSDRLNQKPVYIVPSDLEQVFINIINNSMDALSESKNTNKRMILTITEAFDKHNHPMMVIKIKDNAGGMNADALKNVFKPFFTTKKPGKGTGLGLNISQGLVKKYSGKLELDSELGKGTTVTVNIPYDSP
jgi:signal transduction histidine kinase